MKWLLPLLLLLAACGDDDDDDCAATCVDTHTVDRCGETVACGEKLCGPDPGGSGAACVASGEACGRIDQAGSCIGPVLAWCFGGEQLVVSDCSAVDAICAEVNAEIGSNCTTECELAGVTAEGACKDNGIEKCVFADGKYRVVQQACPDGTACVNAVFDTGWPGCQASEDCLTAGPVGRCDGEVLTSCTASGEVATDCAGEGKVCTWADDGYVCAVAGAKGARRVAGVIRYEDREPLDGGGLGPLMPLPARGVSVAVVDDASGTVLAAGRSGDDGSYSLSFDGDGMVHVLAATTSNTPGRPLRVIRADGLVHGLASPSFAAAEMTTQDLLATHASATAGAFNTFDMGVRAMDQIVVLTLAPEPLFLVWARGSDDGTYYLGDRNGIFLLGGPSDDDGHDDTVILHEIGHYYEETLGRTDSPGGGHDGSPTNPLLAWSEGFATYFAQAVYGAPIYIDSNAGGGFSDNIDEDVTETPDPGGHFMQDISESMVSQILWDLGDAGEGDDDDVIGDHAAALLVQPAYLGDIDVFADRGVIGADLVDWLDGWFLAGGLTWCAEARGVVTEDHKFPYDYAGPAGACPP